MTTITDTRLTASLYTRICDPSGKPVSELQTKYFSDMSNSVITQYNGVLSKGFIAMFPAVTTAVNCAIEIQKTIRRWNLYQPPKENIFAGIIMDVGQVDSNNKISKTKIDEIKKRFCLAETGIIISTQVVYSSIRSESDIFARDIGRVKLPDFPEPERYYKIYLDEIDQKLESSVELKESLLEKNVNLVDYVSIRNKPITERKPFTRKLSTDSTATRFYEQGREMAISAVDPKELKVAISILENSLDRDDKFIEAKCELAIAYLKIGDIDRGLQTLKESEFIAKSENNQFGIAVSYKYMGHFLEDLDNYPSAIEFYRKSHKLFSEINEDTSEIDDLIQPSKKLKSDNSTDNEKLLEKILPSPPDLKDRDKVILSTMFTELVDYGKYENKEDVLKYHDIEMDKLIPTENGRIIKHITEKILSVFNTPEDAVQCANQIHKYWNEADYKNVKIRVGIHLGEVSLIGDDVFGDSINMAARIEPVALPGTTAVSQIIHHAISQMPDITSIESKAVMLKNIKDPERIYFVYDKKPQILDCPVEELYSLLLEQNVRFFGSETHLGFEDSLAVLYLNNIGSEQDEYLSYGITGDILNSIQKTNLVFLPALADVLVIKDSNDSYKIIGEKLKVDHLLCGSIEKIDGEFNLELQLIHSADEKVIWSEKRTESLSNQETVINDLTITVLNQLKITVPDHIKQNKVKQLTSNPEAYENYLKGDFIFVTGKSGEELEEGKLHLKNAFDADPDFVEARYIYAMIVQKLGNNDSALEILKEASDIAEKNNNDSGIACVQNGFGLIYMMTARFMDAIISFEEALKMRIKLNDLHDQAKISNNLGQCYSNTGQPEKAERRHIRALEINKEVGDDNGVGLTYLNLVILYNNILKYDKGIKAGYDSLNYLSKGENEFAKERLLYNLGQSLIMTGQYSKGEKIFFECIELAKEFKDEIIIGMSEFYLGIYRCDEGRHGLADQHFSIADENFLKKNYLTGKIMLPLEIGLNDFFRGKYSTSRKYMEKTAKLAANINELSYVNMAHSAALMVSSYLGEISKIELDDEAAKFSSENHLIPMRTAWYLSQAYHFQGNKKKTEKFKKISKEILNNIADKFEDIKVKYSFLNDVNFHKQIISDTQQKFNKNSNYQFCYQCGIQNIKNAHYCLKCDTSLEIVAVLA